MSVPMPIFALVVRKPNGMEKGVLYFYSHDNAAEFRRSEDAVAKNIGAQVYRDALRCRRDVFRGQLLPNQGAFNGPGPQGRRDQTAYNHAGGSATPAINRDHHSTPDYCEMGRRVGHLGVLGELVLSKAGHFYRR